MDENAKELDTLYRLSQAFRWYQRDVLSDAVAVYVAGRPMLGRLDYDRLVERVSPEQGQNVGKYHDGRPLWKLSNNGKRILKRFRFDIDLHSAEQGLDFVDKRK